MIQKRGKNSWLIKIYLGRGSDGQEIRYTETFHAPLKSLALARERELKAQFAKIGTGRVEINTLGEWLEHWLKTCAESVSEVTLRWYASHVKTLTPIVGHLKLYTLNSDELKNALQGKLDHLEPRSRRNLHNTLKTAIRAAIDSKKVPYDALAGFKTPRVPKKDRPVLSREDIMRILPLLNKYKHGLVIRIILLTGVRVEEVLGLTWDRVNFQRGRITIDQTVDIKKRELKHDTKTQNSKRSIDLDQETMDLLRQHQQKQASRVVRSIKQKNELVFHADDGRPIRYEAVRRTWAFIKKRAGLPPEMRIHDIRHSVVTLLLSEGEPLLRVASLVGHNPSTTVSKYAQQIRVGKSLLLDE